MLILANIIIFLVVKWIESRLSGSPIYEPCDLNFLWFWGIKWAAPPKGWAVGHIPCKLAAINQICQLKERKPSTNQPNNTVDVDLRSFCICSLWLAKFRFCWELRRPGEPELREVGAEPPLGQALVSPCTSAGPVPLVWWHWQRPRNHLRGAVSESW